MQDELSASRGGHEADLVTSIFLRPAFVNECGRNVLYILSQI